MEQDELGYLDGVPIFTPKAQGYRTCSECGGGEPDTSVGVDGLGARIAFICPNHGVQIIIEPFEEQSKP